MKKSSIILPALILSSAALSAQVTNVAMGQEFQELAAHQGYASNGFSAYQNYTSGVINGSQFFLPAWSSGEVVTVHKEVYNEPLQFLYDKVRQEIFIRKKDSALVLLANKDEIASFSLKDDQGKQYNFVNSKQFTDETPEVFYQVLVFNSTKLTLLKYIKTTLVKADYHDMMKIKEGEVDDSFVDKNIYYIVKADGVLQPVELKNKSIKKVFGELNLPYEKYMNDHYQPVNEDYLIDMVKQMNQ
ncbi:MAG TPA: hypothetical protein VFE04_00280 [Puia sp.]|nr:hypothetical protein [Puia sp.]